VIVTKVLTLQVTLGWHGKWCSLATLENFLWCCDSPLKVFPCKTRHITDDDVFVRREDTKVLSASAESMPKISARQENTKVTIYHGTDCKLYDVVREGKLLGAEAVVFLGYCGAAAYRGGEGAWNETRCEQGRWEASRLESRTSWRSACFVWFR
jgi:hypothetical protein